MLSPFLVISPAHRCDARLAIAAARAGETGILDLGYGEDWPARESARHAARRHPSCNNCSKRMANAIQRRADWMALGGLAERSM
jgi:hypothetical protein